jgi:hypothetical protein
MQNEFAQLQELVEGTDESLIVGDFADIEAATNIVEATVIGNYEEQGEQGRIEEAVIVGIIHDKDKKPMSGDDFAIGDHAMVVAPLLMENSNMIVVARAGCRDRQFIDSRAGCGDRQFFQANNQQ